MLLNIHVELRRERKGMINCLISIVGIVCDVAKLLYLRGTNFFIFPDKHQRVLISKISRSVTISSQIEYIRCYEHAGNTKKLQALSSNKVSREKTINVGDCQVKSIRDKFVLLCNLAENMWQTNHSK